MTSYQLHWAASLQAQGNWPASSECS